MTLGRAQVLEPVSPPSNVCFASGRALGLLLLPDVLEAESSPWPRVRTPSFPEAHTNAEFLAWDIVDEWGAQSFPASDPPSNW